MRAEDEKAPQGGKGRGKVKVENGKGVFKVRSKGNNSLNKKTTSIGTLIFKTSTSRGETVGGKGGGNMGPDSAFKNLASSIGKENFPKIVHDGSWPRFM